VLALIRVAVAALIALIALHFYNQPRFDPETFGLDPTIAAPREAWHGRRFTAFRVDLIKALVADYQKHPTLAEGGCKPFTILWLGNSQLHFVNQAKPGDHIAPYWLRRSLDCPDTTVPIGLSLPNANLQEHYYLVEYVTARVPVNLIVLAICFDKLRNDGLRSEFATIVEQSDRLNLSKSAIGKKMLQVADNDWKGNNAGVQNAGLTGFAQKSLEDRLDAGLGRLSPLWEHRANLRGLVLDDLYYLRNAVLGIKGTTVRRTIPARAARNMQALEALLKDAQERKIPVVAYIQPIRQDLPIPYDPAEYAAWKQRVGKLVPRYGATLLNLEALVPGSQWGFADAKVGVDFMHFRNQGHKLVAAALAPYVRAVQKDER
jgi:hypothetical protein